jgi:hypothetical protein
MKLVIRTSLLEGCIYFCTQPRCFHTILSIIQKIYRPMTDINVVSADFQLSRLLWQIYLLNWPYLSTFRILSSRPYSYCHTSHIQTIKFESQLFFMLIVTGTAISYLSLGYHYWKEI